MMWRLDRQCGVVWVLSWALLGILYGGPAAWAHGPIHEQIADVDRQLAEDPENAHLIFRRGRLYLVHENWDRALADFERARSLAPELQTIDVFEGEAWLGRGESERAARILSAYAARTEAAAGSRSRAAFLLGKARLALDQPLAAATAFGQAIEWTGRPTPDHYLARARALAQVGPAKYPEAIAALDSGCERLGDLVALQRYALELEVELGAFDKALSRLDGMLETSRRQETLLVEKAKVLLAAKRPEAAGDALEAAEAQLAQLPPSRRQTRAMADLGAEIQRLRSDLKKASGD